ncbi:MAG TPA: acyltransferase domain-containing protein [Actinopolymorphaceae bacterium]
MSARLDLLGVRPDLVSRILAARPDRTSHPEAWWTVDRTFQDIVGNLGISDGFGGWPPIPVDGSDVTRHIYIWTFVAAVPHTRRFHAERGIPDDLSREMLRRIGKGIEESRAMYGVSGLLFGQWTPPLILRGVTYALGRLEYDFGSSVNMHIPGREDRGRLEPADCDASISRAREFAARYFPEHPSPRFCCHSWLLDPQLAEYLPAESNLVRFQRRFRMVTDERPECADRDILGYVFGRRAPEEGDIPQELIATLPQDTALRRAFVTHLRSGRHWYGRTGWLLADT